MSLNEIRNNIQHDKLVLEREPTCNTTHHAGCDCQVQRHVREKVELLSLLAFSTEREATYRKALETIEKGLVMYDSLLWARDIARQALSSSPAPEPVTVEELAYQIDLVLASKIRQVIIMELATELLTKFKIERREP